ncbi:hypothetical protein T4B_3290 [Trichinella pseudospiralis]|uniref:Uncharacterized protein n=2 Tax=Trichinella pseudospiralis TaxID=6337 RepID=A0A0V1CI16_TRIPS|nr:hypothetical protein T4A_9153 [Trichinella pseudospiralis]KRY63391.1 hypothetical protein T4D_3751 [Trichinella pseudospiralis]KRY96637.1 hypothetical protein T4B_3290 [Trichinella pseudospiralis]
MACGWRWRCVTKVQEEKTAYRSIKLRDESFEKISI